MHHLLSLFFIIIIFFFTLNKSIRHLGCYQANGVSIDKIHLSNAEETEVALEWHLDDFTHCLLQLRGTCNAFTCSYKCINNVLIF